MPDALKFTDTQKAAFRVAYAPAGATDDQFNLFINECERRALVPGVHVVFQLRSTKEYDKDLQKDIWVKKVIFITTIGALRLIAQRDGHYEGHGPFIYYYGTEDGGLKESKIPLGKQPHAVSVEGYRKDWRVPLFATARYDAYVQKFGAANAVKTPTQMWATRGEEQLAKCCEALMLKTVSPEECAGLLLTEEVGTDAVIDKAEDTTPVTPVVVPLPTVAPKVNQAAAIVVSQVPNIEPAIKALVAEQDKKRGQETKQNNEHATSLFSHTTPPPPEMETRAFPPMKPVVAEQVEPPSPPDVPEPPSQYPAPAEKPAHLVQPDVIALPPAVLVVGAPVATVSDVSAPATRKEYDAFLGRAAKLVRDTLPKAGMKDAEASQGVKNYLLKQSGVTGLKQIPAATFERLLKILEDAAIPEDAAAIVRAQSK